MPVGIPIGFRDRAVDATDTFPIWIPIDDGAATFTVFGEDTWIFEPVVGCGLEQPSTSFLEATTASHWTSGR